LPNHARIAAFVSLHKEFDPDEAELTRTRKLKRKPIEERYEKILSGMYEQQESVSVQSEVAYRDGKVGTRMTDIKVNYLDQ
jgi:long-chain acyl-CoA synthetase